LLLFVFKAQEREAEKRKKKRKILIIEERKKCEINHKKQKEISPLLKE